MIHTTDVAATHIRRMVQRRGKGIGIRVGVKTTGCSGLAYVLEFVDQPTEADIIHQFDGFVVVVDPKHTPYLNEMTIDYARNGLNEGFKFINPIEKDRCGCGSSFRV